ncbi:hypothetical protein [Pseudonocardia sp. TRM90224]|uniref:hypothetical protein n=1 Tax=Pseudonocardia sp. TRM90224 TaxID=2812678 RepID=UPI001E4E3114|nr:hypothetical protein [Pseudonocardia sp. TRM90224]
MDIDLDAATRFMATHARQLDRRRYAHLIIGDDAAGVVAAVNAYRNADGGYGWGLEPDLRSSSSQPGAALHAFEALADAGVATPEGPALCDWLATVALPDGGGPFALPIDDPAGCAPFWADADHTTSSLQITAAVVANAHRLARHDPAVAAHPWLAAATRYCLDAIRALDDSPHAIELMFALHLLDVLHPTHPEAVDLVAQLGKHIPDDGVLPVAGGKPDEALRPLDVAPLPDGPVRALFSADVIAADLDRLASQQEDDGGWTVDFASYSPAAAAEWRGYATVAAVTTLRANKRLGA